MKVVNRKILFNLTFQKVMSVYWSMYYLGSLEKRDGNEKQTKPSSKKKILKIKIKNKVKPISEKKNNDK
jgi:hypothetical protein